MPSNTPAKVEGFDVTTLEPDKLTTRDILATVRAGGRVRLVQSDGRQQSFDMLEDQLSAESAEGLFGADSEDTLSGADLGGSPFLLKSVHFQDSDLKKYPDSLGIFAVLSVELNGQPEIVTSGATDVVMKCVRALELGVLPRWLRIVEETTKSGTKVQNLIDAPSQKAPAAGEKPF